MANRIRAWFLVLGLAFGAAAFAHPEARADGSLGAAESKDAWLRSFLHDFYHAPAKARSPDDPARLAARNAARKQILMLAMPPSAIGADPVADLVQVPTLIQTLKDMESAHLLGASLDPAPWSDSYWPLLKGLIATRYADPAFPNANDWHANFEYVQSHPAPAMIADGHTDILSPAEKYDYLLGDDAYTLTSSIWNSARDQGEIGAWEGICNGWSEASTHFDEPVHAVNAIGIGGRSVRFYPSDIKALGSLLWAKAGVPVGFIGSRCDTSNPPRDEVGRIVPPECQGTNAGSWHLSIVNLIGQAHRGLIDDASLSAEIWNFPAWKYSYSYFNPQSLRPVKHWKDAVTPISAFAIDRFRSYRSSATRFVAGISMELTYAVEVNPSQVEGSQRLNKTVRYVYDVELDENLKIVGGEWYSGIHPEFIWAPKVDQLPVSVGDGHVAATDTWTGTTPLPAGWTQAGLLASPHLQPLAAVVNQLMKLAHQ